MVKVYYGCEQSARKLLASLVHNIGQLNLAFRAGPFQIYLKGGGIRFLTMMKTQAMRWSPNVRT